MNIRYEKATTTEELRQILALQHRNLKTNISEEELKAQGFVTVEHDLELLAAMNHPKPHIIAKDGDTVVGYALVMLRDFEEKVPVLVPMFEMVNNIDYKNEALREATYFVMGQICIDKAYRGQGVFKGLYEAMRAAYSNEFQYLVTEVSANNKRSLKAHANVGFQTIKVFEDDIDTWHVVLWDWQ